MNQPANTTPTQTKEAPISVVSQTPTEREQSPVGELTRLGQRVWLDVLSRSQIRSGRLQVMMKRDGVSGLTATPGAFARALNSSQDYDTDIQELARQGKAVEEIHESLLVRDVQDAANVLRPVYEETGRRDGFVSLSIRPESARNRGAILKDARRLWGAVSRPNVLIQVPATVEGLSAIRQLIVEGINVNVTMLFDLLRYRGVLEAWISGLDARAQWTASVGEMACVASFCLNPVDPMVDALLERAATKGQTRNDRAWQMRGQTAVSNAKIAHIIHQRFLAGFRFTKLANHGATPLRLVWSDTDATNPDYSEVKYIEPLIGRDTVSVMSLETLKAYREHGYPALRLEDGLDQARGVLYELPKHGIEMHEIGQRLEDEGIARLIQSYNESLNAIRGRCREALRSVKSNQGSVPSGSAPARPAAVSQHTTRNAHH